MRVKSILINLISQTLTECLSVWSNFQKTKFSAYKNFLYIIIYFSITNFVFAQTSDIWQVQPEKALCETISQACFQNQYNKIFNKNYKNFSIFIARLTPSEDEFSPRTINYTYSKFIPPVLAIENETYFSQLKNSKEFRIKMTKQIITVLYFNALKNQKLGNLQKEEITLEKECFDNAKNGTDFKAITSATQNYTAAQSELFEYEKTEKLCLTQIANFSGTRNLIEFEKNFDDFEIQESFKNIINSAAKDETSPPSQQEILLKLRYDYLKYKNLTERINRTEKLQIFENYTEELETKKKLLDLKKEQTTAKLACIVDYLGYCNAK